MSFMERFSFVINHKVGSSNKAADALSRKYSLLTSPSFKIVGFDLFPEYYTADPFFSKVLQELVMGKTEIICS